jgi:hypothetical protein
MAPVIPSGLALTPGTDSGESSTDGITSHLQPVLMGVGEPGAAIVATVAGNRITSTVELDGTWQLALPDLPEGPHAVNVQAVDLAGNLSEASPFYSFNLDRTAPNKPVIEGLTPATDSGDSDSDGVTSITPPILMGRAEAGSMVEIYKEGDLLGFARASSDEKGLWTLELELGPGVHTLIARAKDRAGNESEASDSYQVTVLPEDPVPYRVSLAEPQSLWFGDFEDLGAHVGQTPANGGLALSLHDVLAVPQAADWQRAVLLDPAGAVTAQQLDHQARTAKPDAPVVLPPEVASAPLHHEWLKDLV